MNTETKFSLYCIDVLSLNKYLYFVSLLRLFIPFVLVINRIVSPTLIEKCDDSVLSSSLNVSIKQVREMGQKLNNAAIALC